ncbi:SMC-Scp complex subunit ScpB [Stackebrandtia soli]|uniref:SMC-Scp complex subunit ScpB n=1 Tax=Stackebrandtia soli TaxID=1892856 RepID=UPI0039EB0863
MRLNTIETDDGDAAAATGDSTASGPDDGPVPVPASLAAEVAGWTPPWQRATRADSPDDEPVDVDEARRQRPDVASSATAESVSAPAAPAAPKPRAPEPEPPLFAEDLAGTLEAILLVCEEPVSELVLAQALGRPETEVTEALRTLAAQYTGDNRGFDLRRQAGGWRYYTREEFAPFVERFVLDGQQVRLTKAALETLSVVAYKQPVTRGRISAIRGVNCDGVIRTLTMRGLIEECGSDPDSGAHLYRTTSLFLEKLGLNSIAELPPLAPFLPDDITQIGESSEN